MYISGIFIDWVKKYLGKSCIRRKVQNSENKEDT